MSIDLNGSMFRNKTFFKGIGQKCSYKEKNKTIQGKILNLNLIQKWMAKKWAGQFQYHPFLIPISLLFFLLVGIITSRKKGNKLQPIPSCTPHKGLQEITS